MRRDQLGHNQLFTQPSARILPNIWDIVALLIIVSLVALLAWVSGQMSEPFHLGQHIPISLSPWALPSYALQTVTRMFIALFLSFVFSFVVGGISAKSARASAVTIPLIDILQSVPILGYLSITVAGFIALFPGSMWGVQCACIFAVFTSQVWNMTLSFYQSLRTIPSELVEATYVYHLTGWQRFWRLETPYAMPGLLWNAMISMSGGWFFVVAAEAISVANQSITLPGIGSYIAMAILDKNMDAISYAIITMLIVIILYDQLLFRPLVAWSDKFTLTDIPQEAPQSWVLNLLKKTRILKATGAIFGIFADWIVNLRFGPNRPITSAPEREPHRFDSLVSFLWWGAIALLTAVAIYMMQRFIFQTLSLKQAGHVVILGLITGLRVFILIALCSIIWVPIGVWIGMKPRLTQIVQPIAQIFAAFPVNLFYPFIVALIIGYHLDVNIWTAPLMVLGTQWYILFNVIAGATTFPKELKLTCQNFHVKGWLKWKRFLLPAIFPYFITGALTAAGGAWNASIVAEVIEWGHTRLVADGLGAYITINTQRGHFEQVALGVVVMCLLVTLINMLFWRKLYQFAANKYKLG